MLKNLKLPFYYQIAVVIAFTTASRLLFDTIIVLFKATQKQSVIKISLGFSVIKKYIENCENVKITSMAKYVV